MFEHPQDNQLSSKINPVISDVEIVPFRPKDGHLGFASCIIDHHYFLQDIAIFSRPLGGVRLGYPVKKLTNGTILEIFKPLHKKADLIVEQAVLEAYESLMQRKGNGDGRNNGIQRNED